MFHTAQITDVGNGRVNNQDAYLLKDCFYQGKQILLAVMCDGIGGLKRGEVASRFVVESLDTWFQEKFYTDPLENITIRNLKRDLIRQMRTINRKLLLMGNTYGDSMGTTMTLLFGMGQEFFVLNIGDTRAYWFENQRMYVTKDHTLIEEEMKVLTQCLGVTREIQIDSYQGKMKEGMQFLLCTDGFYGRLEEEELYQVPKEKDDMKCWIETMVRTVKKRGELDNLSCVMVKVEAS